MNKKAPVYQNIEKTLRDEILSGRYKTHERFLSELKLKARFDVNAATARKAVDNLVAEGLLYKKPASGTYISPQRKNKTILIVGPLGQYSLVGYCSVEEFAHGPYRFQEVSTEQYLKHLDDLTLIYPELCGILFYRGFPEVSPTFSVLIERNIPFMMYGSSTLRSLLKGVPSLLYSERAIVFSALDHLSGQGCQKMAVFYMGSWPASLERFRQYLSWHKKNDLVPDPDLFADYNLLGKDEDEIYAGLKALFRKKGALRAADGLFCAGDDMAALAIQAAKESGLCIPEDLRIIGVNNDPICSMIRPTMSSVELPVADDTRRAARALMKMIEGSTECPKLHSRIKVIARSSS